VIDAKPAADPRNGPRREIRDVNVPALALLAGLMVLVGAVLHLLLWTIHRSILPGYGRNQASPPVQMSGESTVNARIESIPHPRLDSLKPLQANPPSYRSSRPIENERSPEFHPEDLRADRQPQLKGYEWVDKKKGIARIPIDQAMDAILESGRLGPLPKKGGRP
jgi:hypothetical protein